MISLIGGLTDFEGEIQLNDISLSCGRENYEYLRNVGMLLNDLYSYDFMTVDEFIELNINFKDIEDKSSLYSSKTELIELLFLENFKNHLMKNLSLGTKQKVMLLLSLIHKPNLLLFDEPLVNLDTKSKENTIDFLKSYINNNKAILVFSSHDLNLIKKLSNRILDMKDMKIYSVREEWRVNES